MRTNTRKRKEPPVCVSCLIVCAVCVVCAAFTYGQVTCVYFAHFGISWLQGLYCNIGIHALKANKLS